MNTFSHKNSISNKKLHSIFEKHAITKYLSLEKSKENISLKNLGKNTSLFLFITTITIWNHKCFSFILFSLPYVDNKGYINGNDMWYHSIVAYLFIRGIILFLNLYVHLDKHAKLLLYFVPLSIEWWLFML